MIKVLWLDDDAFFRSRLQVGGFEVIIARSCAEAIEILSVEHPLPEWAIVDLIVPEGRSVPSLQTLPGLEFIRYLRAHHAAVKPVVYTVIIAEQVQEDALSAGALRFFEKLNVSFRGILDEIRDLVEFERSPEELQPEEKWRRTISAQFEKYLYSTKPISREASIALHTAILATTVHPEQRQRSFQTLELLSQSDEAPTPASAQADPELLELRRLVKAIVEHKRSSSTFDALLCYNSQDANEVESVATRLLERGVLPWLDRWQVRPGERWRKVLEEQIQNVKSAVVFVGGNGVGPWQDIEIDALLQEFTTRGAPVIPALLTGAPEVLKPKLPLFLRGAAWVDMSHDNSHAIEQLVWGITGWKVQSL